MLRLCLGDVLRGAGQITCDDQKGAAEAQSAEVKKNPNGRCKKIGEHIVETLQGNLQQSAIENAVEFQEMTKLLSYGGGGTNFGKYLAENAADKQLVALKAASVDVTLGNSKIFISSGGSAFYYFQALQWYGRDDCEIVTSNYAVATAHSLYDGGPQRVTVLGSNSVVEPQLCCPQDLAGLVGGDGDNNKLPRCLQNITLVVLSPTYFDCQRGPADENVGRRGFRKALHLELFLKNEECRLLYLLDAHKLSRVDSRITYDLKSDSWNEICETGRVAIVSTKNKEYARNPQKYDREVSHLQDVSSSSLSLGEPAVYAYNKRILQVKLREGFIEIEPPTIV